MGDFQAGMIVFADSIPISIEKAHMSILLLHTIQANTVCSPVNSKFQKVQIAVQIT